VNRISLTSLVETGHIQLSNWPVRLPKRPRRRGCGGEQWHGEEVDRGP